MSILPNARRERFCQLVSLGMKPQEAAPEVGYASSTQYCSLMHHPQIKTRLDEIKQEAHDQNILDRKQKMKRLSVVALMDIKSPVTAHETIGAIAELNRMDREYDVVPSFNDNRQYNIIVKDQKSKEVLMRLLSGERRKVVDEE